MRFEVQEDTLVNVKDLVEEIQQWQEELFPDTVEDSIIYNTLDSVIDLIVNR